MPSASVYEDILVKVKTEIETVSGHFPVEIRSRATFLQQSDIVPRTIVVADNDSLTDEAFGGQIQMGYPVLVVIMNPANVAFAAEMFKVLGLRQAIRRKLFVPILAAGSTTTCQVEFDPDPAYEGKGVVDGGYPGAAMKFTWWVAEDRN